MENNMISDNVVLGGMGMAKDSYLNENSNNISNHKIEMINTNTM